MPLGVAAGKTGEKSSVFFARLPPKTELAADPTARRNGRKPRDFRVFFRGDRRDVLVLPRKKWH